jgi:hypothetical protein
MYPAHPLLFPKKLNNKKSVSSQFLNRFCPLKSASEVVESCVRLSSQLAISSATVQGCVWSWVFHISIRVGTSLVKVALEVAILVDKVSRCSGVGHHNLPYTHTTNTHKPVMVTCLWSLICVSACTCRCMCACAHIRCV